LVALPLMVSSALFADLQATAPVAVRSSRCSAVSVDPGVMAASVPVQVVVVPLCVSGVAVVVPPIV
jgi:hypothetical protein